MVGHKACVIVSSGPKQINAVSTNVHSCHITCLIRNGLGSEWRCGFEEEKHATKVNLYNYEMPHTGIETESENSCGLWAKVLLKSLKC